MIMNKIFKPCFSLSCLILAVGLLMTSCGSKDNNPAADFPQPSITSQNVEGLPNYRYVDIDTVLMKYNLAKDYTEEMIRMQENLENEVRRHENSIQSFANTMQNKYQNNTYMSEASFKYDQDKLSNMQAEAQRSLASLQSNYENAAFASNKAVNDSIQAFIKEYNAKKGYDAIFIKAATLYISPALDITNEVVEGLNARYNKVK